MSSLQIGNIRKLNCMNLGKDFLINKLQVANVLYFQQELSL